MHAVRTVVNLSLVAAALTGSAWADPIRIVAFGASNTFGQGVDRQEAYPAQLERMLKADGFDVQVRNEGVSGERTDEELARLAWATPAGTRIVILQPGGNDRGTGRGFHAVDTAGNVDKMVSSLTQRGIKVIFSGSPQAQARLKQQYADATVATVDGITNLAPPEYQQRDHQHLTPDGYRIVARTLLPIVESLLRETSP